MHPKISVILPAYNTEKYIEQAIQSVLDQTEKDFEIIVVEDGSSDNTSQIVKELSDNRIHLLENEVNRGLRYSLNRGLRAASGEWIALLDSDDWYSSPERLEALLSVALDQGADLVADDQYFIQDGQQEPLGRLFASGEPFNAPKQMDACALIESNLKPASQSPHYGLIKALIKRSFLTENQVQYHESLWHSGDLHFYLLCLIRGARLFIIPEAYYCYRRYRSGASSTQKSRFERVAQFHQLCLLLMEEENVKENPTLLEALSRYKAKTKSDMDYVRAVEFLKSKDSLKASAQKLLSDPWLFLTLISQAPRIVSNRFSHR
ncbi:MAG: glycosyltransferase family 2 protein [Microcoleaceae cyanobacterium]